MIICYKCRNFIEDSAVQKHGLHPSCFKEWFQLAVEEEDFKDINPRSETPLTNSTFFHGRFRKYSASLARKEYILKIYDDYSELAKTEYLCNQIGVSLGINIPKFYLISFFNKDDCFLSYNFMQNYRASNLKHIYHFLKPDGHYIESILDIIKERTGKYQEIIYFINICLFDALIGNNDRHGRNLAFISNANGYILSPLYDNTSHLGIEDFLESHFKISCAIKTMSSETPGIKEYAEEFIRLGYKNTVEDFLKKIEINEIGVLIENSLISERRKTAFLRYLQNQKEGLTSAL